MASRVVFAPSRICCLVAHSSGRDERCCARMLSARRSGLIWALQDCCFAFVRVAADLGGAEERQSVGRRCCALVACTCAPDNRDSHGDPRAFLLVCMVHRGWRASELAVRLGALSTARAVCSWHNMSRQTTGTQRPLAFNVNALQQNGSLLIGGQTCMVHRLTHSTLLAHSCAFTIGVQKGPR